MALAGWSKFKEQRREMQRQRGNAAADIVSSPCAFFKRKLESDHDCEFPSHRYNDKWGVILKGKKEEGEKITDRGRIIVVKEMRRILLPYPGYVRHLEKLKCDERAQQPIRKAIDKVLVGYVCYGGTGLKGFLRKMLRKSLFIFKYRDEIISIELDRKLRILGVKPWK